MIRKAGSPVQGDTDDHQGHAVQSELIIDRLRQTYYLNDEGVMTLVECIVDITALRDGLSQVHHAWNYPTDPRRGVIEFQPGIGCAVMNIEEPGEGRNSLWIELAIPELNRDESHTYTYRIVTHTDIPSQRAVGYMPRFETKLATLRVHFSRNLVTQAVWLFERIIMIEIPGPRTPETLVLPNPHGAYERTFTNPELGWCYGLSW
jgi:hypothetical protein